MIPITWLSETSKAKKTVKERGFGKPQSTPGQSKQLSITRVAYEYICPNL